MEHGGEGVESGIHELILVIHSGVHLAHLSVHRLLVGLNKLIKPLVYGLNRIIKVLWGGVGDFGRQWVLLMKAPMIVGSTVINQIKVC